MRRERPRVGRTSRPRELCTTIPDDRGDESFADDLNMGRGIVSGRVALLLRSTEIPPHRPKDFPCLDYPSLLPPAGIFPPAKNSCPAGGTGRARGPGSESKEGKTNKERKREKTWGFLCQNSFLPGLLSSPEWLQIGPGGAAPGPRTRELP